MNKSVLSNAVLSLLLALTGFGVAWMYQHAARACLIVGVLALVACMVGDLLAKLPGR